MGVIEAKKEVLFQAAKQDGVKKALVETWMAKLEKGEKAQDPSTVLDECLIADAMGGPRSKECFEFEEAIRNYKAAAEVWTTAASPIGFFELRWKSFRPFLCVYVCVPVSIRRTLV